MRKIASNDDLLTTRQVGEMLGVAVRTVQLWVESGALPAWRTAGGHRRISRGAVEKLVEERALIAVPEAHSQTARDGCVKLLVVEDDPIMRKLITGVVATWSFPVELRTATNGFEGLLIMGQFLPDVVVSDLSMPGMDGFEMLRAVRRKGSGFEGVRLVVVSSYSKVEVQERGGLPQGVRFFEKPVNFQVLADVVREGRLHPAT